MSEEDVTYIGDRQIDLMSEPPVLPWKMEVFEVTRKGEYSEEWSGFGIDQRGKIYLICSDDEWSFLECQDDQAGLVAHIERFWPEHIDDVREYVEQ